MCREQTVRDAAYAIWEAEGRPHGRDAEHWRLAEERFVEARPVEEHVISDAGEVVRPKRSVRAKATAPAASDAKVAAPRKRATPAATTRKTTPKPKL